MKNAVKNKTNDTLMNTAAAKLDLSNAPHIIFLFGLAGSGKSFIGDLIGELAGWPVYHADDDISDDMAQALAEHRPFTPAMRDQFFAIIIKKIAQLQTIYPHLVVTQAVYKQQHRQQLQSALNDMDMIMVDARDALIVERINERRGGGISQQSAAALRQDFEAPDDDIKVIHNNGDWRNVVRQLNGFYAA